MCCLNSLSVVLEYIKNPDVVTQKIIPIFLKACKDDIPNVKFCVSRIIHDKRAYIDNNVYSN